MIKKIEKDLISVIVPIYNVEDYLVECIESLIVQTYRNIEILLINDGSTDNCATIAKEFSERDCRVIYIEKSNGGLSEARNYGIYHSKGKYLTFVDSDDKVSSDYIANLYNAIQKHDSSIAIGGYLEFYERHNSIRNYEYLDKVIPVEEALLNMYDIKTYGSIFITAWGKLFHKSIFNDLEFALNKYHEDEFFHYKAYLKANSITYIDKPLYHYRIRVGSIMNNSDNVIIARKKLDVLSALDERIKLITSLRKYSVFLQKTEIFYVNQYFRTKKFLKQQSVMFKEDNYIDAYRMYGRLLRKVKLVDKLKLIKNRFF